MANSQGWEEFNRQRDHSDELVVTLSQRGNLSLGHAAREALGHPGHVKLHFHAERNAIGVRAAEAEDEDAYPLTRGGSLAALDFVEYFGINTQGSMRYRAITEGNMLVFDLVDPDS